MPQSRGNRLAHPQIATPAEARCKPIARNTHFPQAPVVAKSRSGRNWLPNPGAASGVGAQISGNDPSKGKGRPLPSRPAGHLHLSRSGDGHFFHLSRRRAGLGRLIATLAALSLVVTGLGPPAAAHRAPRDYAVSITTPVSETIVTG